MGSQSKTLLKRYVKQCTGSDKDDAIKAVLKNLYVSLRMGPTDIKREIYRIARIRLTTYAIRYWIKQYGIPLRSNGQRVHKIEQVIQGLFGDMSIADYFKLRQGESFVAMADELMLSTSTVQRAYKEFRENA